MPWYNKCVANLRELKRKQKWWWERFIILKKLKLWLDVPCNLKILKLFSHWKPRFFKKGAGNSETSGDSDEKFEEHFGDNFEVKFQKLLKRLFGLDMFKLIEDWLSVASAEESHRKWKILGSKNNGLLWITVVEDTKSCFFGQRPASSSYLEKMKKHRHSWSCTGTSRDEELFSNI